MADAQLVLADKALALDILFQTHRLAVRDVQRMAKETLFEELQMEGQKREWGEGYIADEGTIFRLYRKNGFNTNSTLNALRLSLSLPTPPSPSAPHPSIMLSHISPHPPVLHLALSYLTPASLPYFKHSLLQTYEHIRVLLSQSSHLGFYCVLDLEGARVRDALPDLLPYYKENIQPRYPSMCAAIFVINYTWAYAGLWAIVRRVAPVNALSRIFFLDSDVLSSQFPFCALPSPPPSPPLSPSPSLTPLTSRTSTPFLPFPLSFSAITETPPERTRLALATTLLQMWTRKLRTWKWWVRWGWVGWVVLWLLGRLWMRRRKVRSRSARPQ